MRRTSSKGDFSSQLSRNFAAANAMRIVAKGSRCKDPALHIVLSFGPENTGHNDPSVLRDCIKKTLQALEMYDHQHIAILHRDTQHTR
ncbi:MAG: relaxase/mobilization nuclease domain-containing protein [Proteobacteria bacterium]|nr:relaxase/mobilization nuclease domain-containing protein [Pseudomonadota bacterium]